MTSEISLRINRRVLALAAWAVIAGACSSTSGAPAAGAVSPDVWAVVDGREIRRDDVEKVYRGTQQPNAAPLSDEEALAQKLSVLDDFINQDILIARARVAGVEATDAEVEKAFADTKNGMADEAFAQQVSQRGLSLDDFKRGLRRDLSAQKIVDRDVTSTIAITDAEIEAFYNQNRAQFNVTEPQYRIAQILVTPERDPQLRNRLGSDAATPAEARAKFDDLMARLKAGADFASLAADYSEDPQTVAVGGDLGYVSRTVLNQAAPQLRDIVLKTDPGKVGTANLGGAYTIVMVIAREAAGQRELSSPEVRDGIREILRARRDQAMRAAYIAIARDSADVVNHLAQRVVDGQGRAQ